jgi:ABC-2 type transport system ATP-binding protein
VRKRVGFLPENPPLYTDMLVEEYLYFAGQLRQMTRAEVDKRMPDVLGITNLDDVAREVIGTLSHGYRQRVGVAQAIIHQPKFLILDEPTRGLDPVQIVDMRNLIHDLKQSHTVLISSHILTEISQTCDRLIVLKTGELQGIGTETELAGHVSEIRQITVTVRAPAGGAPYRSTKSQDDSDKAEPSDKDVAESTAAIKKVLEEVDGVKSVGDGYVQGGGLQFWLETTKDCRAEVSRAVVNAKLDLLKLDYARSELENTFIRLVGGSDASN